MKKFFVFAAAAAFALVACNKDNHTVQGSGNQGGDAKVAGLVLNELSGADKYIELYNTTDKEINLDGVYLVKYDSSKEGGQSTTWTGKGGIKIAAKGFVVLESSDLADEAEGGDPAYAYESANHVFKGGLSGKKNVFIELYSAAGEKLSEFKRGERVQDGTRFQASTTTRSTLSHAYRTEQVSSYTLTLQRALQTVLRLLTSSRLLKCNSPL